jgi:hypothetical protein
MFKIFKYSILASENFSLELPGTFKVVSVAVQRGDAMEPQPVLYVLVDTNVSKELVDFHVYPTGVEINGFVARHKDYLGCARIDYGGPIPDMYFHIFGRQSGGGL